MSEVSWGVKTRHPPEGQTWLWVDLQQCEHEQPRLVLGLIMACCLSLGQVAAGCRRKQHHHRGEQQESPRQTIPLGGCRRYGGFKPQLS